MLVTHGDDPDGRPTLFAALKTMGVPPCISVGRLDYTSEGLLLLTNNGSFDFPPKLFPPEFSLKNLTFCDR